MKGVNYPTAKTDLVKKATDEDADDNVRSVLERRPDQRSDSPTDVSEAIGKIA
ncbi:MAG TPA: DUF2795 domain-containing protein [Thermomicrobiales bacterium]|nr:DUF2795 domain-containing protein [Thermomicrobiales bacterium]